MEYGSLTMQSDLQAILALRGRVGRSAGRVRSTERCRAIAVKPAKRIHLLATGYCICRRI